LLPATVSVLASYYGLLWFFVSVRASAGLIIGAEEP
jgi:hypothetical protein